MAFDIFGYTFRREEPAQTEKSFVAPTDDGAYDTFRAGGHFATYLDLDGAAKTEGELIKKYRDISLMADVDMAIEDIVNESIANVDNDPPIKINLKNAQLSDNIKKDVEKSFKKIERLMKLNQRAHDYFRRWYIDGRIHFHKVIDTTKPNEGLKDIRYIDPRKIKKIREIFKEKDVKTGVDFIKKTVEYYVYNASGVASTRGSSTPITTQGLKITPDSIAYAPSGLVDQDNNMVLSYMHKAIKPANQLRMMENALVIYRLARAPERRIFYIDVGNLPKIKAEQYVKDQMNRYRNKLVYDSNTGEMRDDKKYMSMLEDFWLPRREGGKGTEIDTLPGGDNLGQIEDVIYFQKKLYQSLNVPMSRLEQQGGLNFGRAAEITRDELKFVKFIDKLQNQFSMLFHDLLRTELVLTKVMTAEEWDEVQYDVRYEFAQDAYYAESKKQEILRSRFDLLGLIAPYQGLFVDMNYCQKEVLNMTDEDIRDIAKGIAKDPPNPMGMGGMMPGGGNPELDPKSPILKASVAPAPSKTAPKKKKAKAPAGGQSAGKSK